MNSRARLIRIKNAKNSIEQISSEPENGHQGRGVGTADAIVCLGHKQTSKTVTPP